MKTQKTKNYKTANDVTLPQSEVRHKCIKFYLCCNSRLVVCVCHQCVSLNLVFEPSLVLTDFVKAAMNAVSTVLPASRLHGCRFHLGQSWWRRIHKVRR